MSFEDAELLKEFVVESQEHLSDVENQLLTLESQGEQMDVALVNTVFRAIHSIKGAAGFLGLDTLQGLAHREEEVLNRLRNQDLRPTSAVINTLLKATDRLKGLLDDIESSNGQDVSDHLVALERILNGEAEASPSAPAQSESQPANEGLSTEALREFLVESYDNLEQLERDLMALERNNSAENIINSAFRSIHTIKGTAGFLGFTKLEKVTHLAENLLGSIRSGTLALSNDISSGLFQAIDAVRNILAQIEKIGGEGKGDFSPLETLLSSLQEGTAGKSKKGGSKKRTTKSTAKKSPAQSEQQPAPEMQSEQAPAAGEAQPEIEKAPIASPVSATAPVASAAPVSTPADNAAPAKPAPKEGEASAADSTIRVDVALLDKLMTCVGELVLARNQILQFTNGNVDSELHSTSQRLNIITTELQKG